MCYMLHPIVNMNLRHNNTLDIEINGRNTYCLPNISKKMLGNTYNLNILFSIVYQSILKTYVKYTEVHVAINHKCSEDKKGNNLQ